MSLELDRLAKVANELREVFSERSHHVESALAVDPAFGSTGRRSESHLSRDLALEAISRAASQMGLDLVPVNGEGRELRLQSPGLTRRYRVRKAQKVSEGDYRITAHSEGSDEPEDLFGREEHWVFAYTLDSVLQIEDVFVAPIIGRTQGQPGNLVLGSVTLLLQVEAPEGSFSPALDDDSLGGLDLDESAGATEVG